MGRAMAIRKRDLLEEVMRKKRNEKNEESEEEREIQLVLSR